MAEIGGQKSDVGGQGEGYGNVSWSFSPFVFSSLGRLPFVSWQLAADGRTEGGDLKPEPERSGTADGPKANRLPSRQLEIGGRRARGAQTLTAMPKRRGSRGRRDFHLEHRPNGLRARRRATPPH
jgi:hypothetical protein